MLFVIVSTYVNRDHIFYVIHSSIDLPDCTTKTFDAVITKTIKTVASKAILDLDKSRVIVYLIYFSSQKFLFLELNNFYNIYTNKKKVSSITNFKVCWYYWHYFKMCYCCRVTYRNDAIHTSLWREKLQNSS